MVAFRIVYSEDALADLQGLVEHIRTDNPEAASRFGTGLLNHIDLLATFPHLGSPVARRRGVRSLVHSPVRVYYRLDESRRLVESVHIWHGARLEPRWD